MDIKTARKDKCCFWTAGEYFLSWITRVSKTKHWRHTPVGRAAAHTRVGRILPAAAAARTRACTVPSETWLYLILLPPVLYVHSSKVAQYGWRWGTTGEGINHCSSRARGGGLAARVPVKPDSHWNTDTWVCRGHLRGSFQKYHKFLTEKWLKWILVTLKAKG